MVIGTCQPSSPNKSTSGVSQAVHRREALRAATVGRVEGTTTDLGTEALRIATELIRLDTTNTGDSTSVGERQAAQYVMGLLQEVGYQPQYFESEPRRGTVLLRIEGSDAGRPGLVLHGHLDVVPAEAMDWQTDPFGGEIIDGYLWGRGAVDMKDMDAMMLAVVRQWAQQGLRPPRDVLLCFFADEEAGGRLGSHWTVEHHAEFFAGATEAVGEVGGYSTYVAGRRVYLLQTAEKGLTWLRLVARGTAGHGSASNPDNAVVHLVNALQRVARQAWPGHLNSTMQQLLSGAADLAGLPIDLAEPDSWEPVLAAFGPARRWVAPSTATACNLTGLQGGSKVNVVPGQASGLVDMRPLPGHSAPALEQIEVLAGPHVSVEQINQDAGIEAPIDCDLVQAMQAALNRADPEAAVLPYMMPGGTDAKALSRLGIAGYGFAPLQLPVGFDFTAMFHGVDERVPVQAIDFGANVLADFLAHC